MTRRAVRRHRPLLAVPVLALTVLTAVTACSSGSPAASPAGTGRPAAPSAAAGGASDAAAAGAAGASGAVPSAPLAPLRSAGDKRGNTIAYAPVTLRREGALVVLELGVHNTTPPGKGDDDYNIVFDFMANGDIDFEGVSLVDLTNRKRHVVVADSAKKCLCTSFFGGITVPRDGRTVLTAYFAAPPPDVKAMDVVLAKRGTFPAVPVS